MNDERSGPYSIEDLAALHITCDTLVWTKGFPDWQQASEVYELATLFHPPLIPAHSPASRHEEDDDDEVDDDEEDDDEDIRQWSHSRRSRTYRHHQEKATDSAFFTLIKPYLQFIDKGQIYRKPFSWLYKLIAGLNLLLPLVILYQGIENDVLNFPSKMIVASFLSWLVFAFAGWISFQLWWDRSDKVLQTSEDNADFPATPVIAHFIQTFGEWLGTYVVVVGFFVSLFTALFLSDEADLFGEIIPYFGAASIIVIPLAGFLIIIFFRLLAEQIRALVTIANNTKKTNTGS
jgi:hypothetical protein